MLRPSSLFLSCPNSVLVSSAKKSQKVRVRKTSWLIIHKNAWRWSNFPVKIACFGHQSNKRKCSAFPWKASSFSLHKKSPEMIRNVPTEWSCGHQSGSLVVCDNAISWWESPLISISCELDVPHPAQMSTSDVSAVCRDVNCSHYFLSADRQTLTWNGSNLNGR